MEIIKSKTKAVYLIVILCLLITTAMFIVVHDADAATLAEPVDYEQEGCTSIQEWVATIQSKRATNATLCNILKAMYKNYMDENITNEFDAFIDTCNDVSTIEEANENRKQVDEWKVRLEQLKATKDAETEAKRKAAEEASQQQQQAQSYETVSYSFAENNAATVSNNYSNYSWDGSARDFIVSKESGGNYSATNGRYYGAYQLDISYLNGDLSQENQDRVAENYVNNRYGGWEGAMSFWQSHGWY